MLSLSTTLRYYKHPVVQRVIAWHSLGREVGVKLITGQFAKRPNAIEYPSDVLEFAKNRASSFHVSEEHWKNAWALSPSLKRKELDELREGWDLVIDLDFPLWEASKIIASAIVRALREHKIQAVSAKFSGNKGFHVGVPFRAFPLAVLGKKTSSLFPEGPKKIISYLVNYIDGREKDYPLSRQILSLEEFQNYIKENPEAKESLILEVCKNCGNVLKHRGEKKVIYKCENCGYEKEGGEKPYEICPFCSRVMKRIEVDINEKCEVCGSRERVQKINLGIDEVLIASRHLYRAPFSLHEKSGLVSIPVSPDAILDFDKEIARPSAVVALLDDFKTLSSEELIAQLRKKRLLFLDPELARVGEASLLLQEAFDFEGQNQISVFALPLESRQKKAEGLTGEKENYVSERKYGDVELAMNDEKEKAKGNFQIKLEEETYPPCIKLALKGVSDGRKRLLFILFNFFRALNLEIDEIEKRIEEWNNKNDEPLRPNLIKRHIEYHRKRKAILPPNCDSPGYYKDIGICHPDNICRRIKNPAAYPFVYTKVYLNQSKKKKRKRK